MSTTRKRTIWIGAMILLLAGCSDSTGPKYPDPDGRKLPPDTLPPAGWVAAPQAFYV